MLPNWDTLASHGIPCQRAANRSALEFREPEPGPALFHEDGTRKVEGDPTEGALYPFATKPEEQSRRLRERITDGRKTWKLSPTDLESYGRWDDYTRARDEMLKASDSKWAPWYVVRSDDKRRARLNLIQHLLDHIPYERKRANKVKLPDRRSQRDDSSSGYPFKFIPEHDWTHGR